MRIDWDENELARVLRKVGEEEFVRVIVAGHMKFRGEGCGCDICLGKFGEDAMREGGEKK